MDQDELEYAVAEVTGESLSTIKRLGFGLVDEGQLPEESECFGSIQTTNIETLDRRKTG